MGYHTIFDYGKVALFLPFLKDQVIFKKNMAEFFKERRKGNMSAGHCEGS